MLRRLVMAALAAGLVASTATAALADRDDHHNRGHRHAYAGTNYANNGRHNGSYRRNNVNNGTWYNRNNGTWYNGNNGSQYNGNNGYYTNYNGYNYNGNNGNWNRRRGDGDNDRDDQRNHHKRHHRDR